MNWEYKEIWKLRERNFTIEVSRHEAPKRDEREGINRWCVYAYIYPEHPLFKEFKGESIWQDATDDLPLHGGCTFLEYHRDVEKITSVQVGADYHHDGDARFTEMESKEDAAQVFNDAQRLREFLVSYQPVAAQTPKEPQ